MLYVKGTATPSPGTPMPLRLRDCDAASLRSCVRARLYNRDSYQLCVSITLNVKSINKYDTYGKMVRCFDLLLQKLKVRLHIAVCKLYHSKI